MSVKRVTFKINWQQVLIIFTGGWFFGLALYFFSCLFYLNFLEAAVGQPYSVIRAYITSHNIGPAEAVTMQIITGVSRTAGALLVLLTMLIIFWVKRWSLIHPIIAFILLYSIGWLDQEWWIYIAKIFTFPASLAHSMMWRLILRGTCLLVVAIAILSLLFIRTANLRKFFQDVDPVEDLRLENDPDQGALPGTGSPSH